MSVESESPHAPLRALVVGGTSGIGRATVETLARAGYDVSITYRTNRVSADDMVSRGLATSAWELDLSDPAFVESWVNGEGRNALDVEVLVVSAGEILRPSGWREMTVEDAVETFAVHAIAPVFLARAASEMMSKRKSGRIIFTSSTYGLNGAAGVLFYSAAKASLTSVTRALARELGPFGITVNCVAPGNIDTAMTQSAGPDVIEWVVSTTPLGRLGTADEVAAQTLYFVQNSFVTGQIAVVDGGHELLM